MSAKPRQKNREFAIAALSAGDSQADAARRAGVNARTIQRWLDDDAFVAAVREARAAALDSALGRLHSLSLKAATTLGLLLSPRSQPSIRLAAARAVLEASLRLRESLDFEARLADVEAKLQSSEHSGETLQ